MARSASQVLGNRNVRICAASRQTIGSPVVDQSLRPGDLRSRRRPCQLPDHPARFFCTRRATLSKWMSDRWRR
ncbi:MAG: hypothetical protein CAPSK01_003036 [Candidatus Accumulibacter vicinus]|uniref:Uncharacterized protein n=1 Tax=Candidatus Accumulibacter vicinus TaxID=2954382 RepID=A0A084XYP9_9PROT|nr:MAG: hypothetical protein CAPSK01_003036 [Candidatus Accumulibacter vicinus]